MVKTGMYNVNKYETVGELPLIVTCGDEMSSLLSVNSDAAPCSHLMILSTMREKCQGFAISLGKNGSTCNVNKIDCEG